MVINDILDLILEEVEKADVFGGIENANGRLICRARGCESDANYRVDDEEAGRMWVSFVTPDRWLSESIEADLEHSGDELDELLEEELAELGIEKSVTCEHFRSEDLLFTFRSLIALDSGSSSADAARIAAKYLLAYEAAFRELGDVAPSDENAL